MSSTTTTTHDTGSATVATNGAGAVVCDLLIYPDACTALVVGLVESGDQWPISSAVGDVFNSDALGLSALIQGF